MRCIRPEIGLIARSVLAITVETWQCSVQITFLWWGYSPPPFSILPPVNSSAQSLPPFPAVSSLRSGSHRSAFIIITESKLQDRPTPPRKLHSRFSADPILISKSRSLSRAHEGFSSRDNIDRERKKGRERERESAERDWRDFLSLSLSPRVYLRLTTHVPRERATDRARASKSNASASDTPGSRSFQRSYVGLLARALCLSLSPWAFPVRLPRGLSFAPSLSTGQRTHSFTIVRSLSRRFLLSFNLWCRRSPSSSFFLSVTLSTRHDHPYLWSLRSHSSLAPTDYKSFDLSTSLLAQMFSISYDSSLSSDQCRSDCSSLI